MCTHTITIVNNSSYINPSSGFDYYRNVPCGKCVQCQYTKQSEYAIRCYYEQKEVKLDNGFVYFDTLTYRDSCLPKWFGVACFQRSDVRKFNLRMRNALRRRYHIDSDAYRYIITSEYGEEYGRVHYHVLFFVHTDRITPKQFHALIHECWTYGNTDLNNAADYRNGIVEKVSAALYVTKYIVKEDSQLQDRLSMIMSKFGDILDRLNYSENKDFARQFRYRFQPFHLQSNGLGSYLERCPDQIKSIHESQTCTMPTKLNPNKEYRVPLYHLRRLFYQRTILPNGKESWIPNDEYKQILFDKEVKLIDDAVRSMNNKISSLDTLVKLSGTDELTHKIDTFKISTDCNLSSLSSCIVSVLGSRSVEELVIYNKYFRFRTGYYIPVDESIYDVITQRLDKSWLGKEDNPLMAEDYDVRKANRRYFKSHCIHDLYDERWIHFDAILDIIDSVYKVYTDYAIITDIEERNLKRRLRDSKLKL